MKKSVLFRHQLLEYDIAGAGVPVMLVHGFTEDRRIWEPLLKGIKKDFLFILPDLPGSGGSSFNKSLTQLADFADALKAIADYENIHQFILIGHSMGGYISLAFAQKYANSLLGLGLFHSSAYVDSNEKKETREKNIRFIEKNGPALFISQAIPRLFSEKFKSDHEEMIDELITRYSDFRPEALVQYLEAMKNRPDMTDVLKTFTEPVLFIIGEEDKAVPMKDSLEQSHLPNISHIHILENTAHMGMIENTNLCRSFVEEFLANAGQTFSHIEKYSS